MGCCTIAALQRSDTPILHFIASPTGLHYSGNQTVKRGLAKRQARTPELAQITVAPAAHRAAVDQARWAGVARQFRQAGVVALRFELRPLDGVFLYRIFLA